MIVPQSHHNRINRQCPTANIALHQIRFPESLTIDGKNDAGSENRLYRAKSVNRIDQFQRAAEAKYRTRSKFPPLPEARASHPTPDW
jgi:hypothetical protein